MVWTQIISIPISKLQILLIFIFNFHSLYVLFLSMEKAFFKKNSFIVVKYT